MTKQKISIQQVNEDLREIFKIQERPSEEDASYVIDNSFYVDKRVFGRQDVIAHLSEYFKDKIIDGGYLKLEGITFVFTKFKILEGKPNV